MAKRVIVIASGETERLSLPHLLSYLKEEGIYVDDVRIPPRNRTSLMSMTVESLIKAAWYENC